MSNVFLASAFLICYLGFFSYGHALLGVERGFSGLSFGPVSTAVVLYDDFGEKEAFPYYSAYFVKRNVEEHAAKNIAPYAKDYRIDYSFLNAKTNRADPLTPTKVRIRVRASIAGISSYDRTATFVLKEASHA